MNARRNLSAHLNVETLEDRRTPATISRPDANGVVTIDCGNGADRIVMSQDSNYVYCNNTKIAAGSVKGVIVNLGGGDDTADLRGLWVPTVVHGGDGNDLMFGGHSTDRLFGEGDDDRLIGGDGYDYLYGGSGINFMDDCNRNGHEYYSDDVGQEWIGDVVANHGTTAGDIRQGQAGTCSFLSTLAGMARSGVDMTRYIRYAGYDANTGVGCYDVSFWTGRQWYAVRVQFDGHTNMYDTKPSEDMDSWVIIMQRAWFKFHGNGGAGLAHEAMFALGRSVALTHNYVNDADYTNIVNALGRNMVVVVGTKPYQSQVYATLENMHAYTVVAAQNGWVQVRNPWGYDGGKGNDGNTGDALVWVRWDLFRASTTYIAIS